MPVRKTVFVIGAGASKEAGLPVGAELKESIATALDMRAKRFIHMNGDTIVEALRWAAAAEDPPGDINPYRQAARQICKAMPLDTSIDNFINTHQGDAKIERCGKIAIVKTILAAEKDSLLYVDQTGPGMIDYRQLAGTWFNTFFQLLTQQSTVSDFKERLSSISLVIFNYDRCVELYLYDALQTYYSLSANDAASVIKNLEIYHPYGTVGGLPWEGPTEAVDFGDTPSATQLLHLADRIKTFTEGTDPASSKVTAIQERVRTSMTLVFLGFSFLDINLDLLMPRQPSCQAPAEKRVFATAVGISTSDAEVISLDLAARCGMLDPSNVAIRPDLACGQLFREYSRSMSLL